MSVCMATCLELRRGLKELAGLPRGLTLPNAAMAEGVMLGLPAEDGRPPG